MSVSGKENMRAVLQTDILRMQGIKAVNNTALDIGLGPLREAFPNASFPLGAIHEFVSTKPEETAAAIGFMSGVLSILMAEKGVTLWISSSRMLFPPALQNFGVNPDKVQLLKSGPLRITGSDTEGEVRVIELPNHPFFLGTLFVPQARSTLSHPHPLVNAFLSAVESTDSA